jgi:hypothetical protein
LARFAGTRKKLAGFGVIMAQYWMAMAAFWPGRGPGGKPQSSYEALHNKDLRRYSGLGIELALPISNQKNLFPPQKSQSDGPPIGSFYWSH